MDILNNFNILKWNIWMTKFAQQWKTKTLLFRLTCSFSTITITLSIVNTYVITLSIKQWGQHHVGSLQRPDRNFFQTIYNSPASTRTFPKSAFPPSLSTISISSAVSKYWSSTWKFYSQISRNFLSRFCRLVTVPSAQLSQWFPRHCHCPKSLSWTVTTFRRHESFSIWMNHNKRMRNRTLEIQTLISILPPESPTLQLLSLAMFSSMQNSSPAGLNIISF